MWEKTGCLITVDGSEDKKIQPGGLSNYEVRPSIPIEPNEAPPCSNFVDPMEEDETNIEDEENQEEDGNMLEDNVRDRDITGTIVGKKLKALYENEWFIGDIMYFNTAIEEYKVVYSDRTSDYIRKDDFDGVQIILL